MNLLTAKVIIDNRASNTDKPYTYLVKNEMEEDIREGMRVIVPFGLGNRMIKGIVIKLEYDNEDINRLKYIEEVLDDKPIISEEMIELCLWMRDYYLSSYMDALHVAMPPGDFKKLNTYIYIGNKYSKNSNRDLNPLENDIIDLLEEEERISYEEMKGKINSGRLLKTIRHLEEKGFVETSLEVETKINKKYEKYIYLNNSNNEIEELLSELDNRAIKQKEVIKYLFEVKESSMKALLKATNTSSGVVKALEKKGKLTIIEKEVLRDPIPYHIAKYDKHELTDLQEDCLNTILNDIKHKKHDAFLIHGVTGSGKTEVYLQLIEKYLEKGKDVIVLVPEISLTPQTVERFAGRFGENVAVLHSRLSYGERFDEWRRIREGKVQIVVGARSAIFAPFKNLGLVVIDEEHENSYKSSMNPKYDAIEVAEKRCNIEGATLIMGTATPSIETYYRAVNGEIGLITLAERVNNKALPEMSIIDMREELDKGNKSIFSNELFNAIEENLKNKKQTMLFLNRRGHSTFVSCRKCGYVVKCKNCDVTMTYHLKENRLKCHYCGLSIKVPTICPDCNSKYIKYFGIGTQKIEEEIKRYFPQAVVARMDFDTTSKKNSHLKIFNSMKKGDIDILIGTQMITKGLDFPFVTLVGIIAADTSLNLPDFRSSERTYQLLTQVGGRAGRGDFEGKVIVQTYNPEHFSIALAKKYDYFEFYNREINIREKFGYPPFKEIINILVYGIDEKKVALYSKDIYNSILKELETIGKNELVCDVFGPNPALLNKLNNNFRWQIVIKTDNKNIEMLKEVVKWVCIKNSEKKQFCNLKYSIDINPNSIL